MSVTPQPTFPIETIIGQVALPLISATLVTRQIYLVYRQDKARLKIEGISGLLEKCELDIAMLAIRGTEESLSITNKGLLGVDELEARARLVVERKSAPKLSTSLVSRELPSIIGFRLAPQ